MPSMTLREWLRVGKRRELAIVCVAVLFPVVLLLENLSNPSGDRGVLLTVIGLASAGFILMMCIPALIYVRWQRKREGKIGTRSNQQTDSRRGRGYVIVFIAVLASS